MVLIAALHMRYTTNFARRWPPHLPMWNQPISVLYHSSPLLWKCHSAAFMFIQSILSCEKGEDVTGYALSGFKPHWLYNRAYCLAIMWCNWVGVDAVAKSLPLAVTGRLGTCIDGRSSVWADFTPMGLKKASYKRLIGNVKQDNRFEWYPGYGSQLTVQQLSAVFHDIQRAVIRRQEEAAKCK